jgi:flagellar biosynthesis protein FlhF
MKIRTYTARDMRSALRLVRDGQGPDAVILSSRQVAGGVEVTAAVDTPDLPLAAVAPVVPSTPAPVAALMPAPTPIPALTPMPMPMAAVAESGGAIGEELRSLRHMLESQLARLAWNDLTRRAPEQAALLQWLTEMGLPQPLACELVAGLPAGLSADQAEQRALAALAGRLSVTGDRWLEEGGRIAFVGPTGVGKTTAIARLAARWVIRHGARDLAIISLDNHRFGADEQTRVLGRLLGVETFVPEDVAALPALLARLSERRCVLVDTAGLGPRDVDLPSRGRQLQAFAASSGLQVCLTLSAGAQSGVLEQALARFAAFQPGSLLVTKLDEATSLGGLLGVLAGARLPLSYLCEGQRIPEDMIPARAEPLVARAADLAREHGAAASEDLLTRRFGGVAHVFA